MSIHGASSLQLSDYMLIRALTAPADEPVIEYDWDDNAYQRDLDAWEEGKLIGHWDICGVSDGAVMADL